jgi:signal transduction histidine kinase
MASDWHVVLGRDGTVLGVADGAPAAWLGTRFADRSDIPNSLKNAGRFAVEEANHSTTPVETTASVAALGHRVDFVVIDALPLRREPTDLTALLQSTLHVMQPQAQAFDVTIHLDVAPDVPSRVSVDAQKIAWAITMLVGNALRYVRHGSQRMPGGTIEVRVGHDPSLREVALEVQDDGPGIPSDRLPLLFNNVPPSSGALGLAMIRDVVSAHGGKLEVRSDDGALTHGTTIRLTLPVA